MARKKIPVDARTTVLHEAGYMCSNPSCKMVITLDVHHLDPVSNQGGNDASNLIGLCPNCHRRHHNGEIPLESLRAWKLTQLALTHAFSLDGINVLLMLFKLDRQLFIKPDSLFEIAGLIVSELVSAIPDVVTTINSHINGIATDSEDVFRVELTSKGKMLVENWKKGFQPGQFEEKQI